MSEDYSKERKQAEAEFARTQSRTGSEASAPAIRSEVDERTARLRAARLARDGAEDKLKSTGTSLRR